jgi:hypothetical protein
MRFAIRVAVAGALAISAGGAAHAHNAICSCFDNGDDTITCEGGFSDGGKAEGVPLRVYDQTGKVLVEGKMGKNSDFSFARPKVAFRVEFEKIDGRDIEE